jgi:radical SAM protein (TIGR01212 family)
LPQADKPFSFLIFFKAEVKSVYKTANQYYKETFGCKVYKLAISGGMSCPNRDGTLSDSGCIFCSAFGSGDFAEQKCSSIYEQIEKAKSRVSNKIKTNKYIAYFQDFTNTYAPVEYLEKIFTEAISHPDIVALSIATRPDCLPDDVLNLLENLNKIKPVWVELGLQTIHPATAELINRQYDLSVFDQAVFSLKNRGIEVIVHMIIGLPDENKEMIVETAKHIGNIGSDGIKFHLLHILSDTDLGKEYLNGNIDVLSMEEYIDILEECVRVIPPDMVIHRLTGDGDKKKLLAPLWSGDKKTVLNSINKAFERDNVRQGEKFVSML